MAKELTHLGIIMDGNGRWATRKGLPRTAGHLEGLKALKTVINGCIANDIRYLTLYCFSTENWKRPASEVNYLMALFTNKIYSEMRAMDDLGVAVRFLGNREGLPEEALKNLDKAIEESAHNSKLTVQLAINYGGYDEICRSVNKLIQEGYTQITPELIRSKFDNPDIPVVDFIARSAGEYRLSNFLLFDSAYAEFGFYDKLWPEWDENMVTTVKEDYLNRTRRYGGLV